MIYFAGKLKQAKIRMRCLDLYPYNTVSRNIRLFMKFNLHP